MELSYSAAHAQTLGQCLLVKDYEFLLSLCGRSWGNSFWLSRKKLNSELLILEERCGLRDVQKRRYTVFALISGTAYEQLHYSVFPAIQRNTANALLHTAHSLSGWWSPIFLWHNFLATHAAHRGACAPWHWGHRDQPPPVWHSYPSSTQLLKWGSSWSWCCHCYSCLSR